jgi:hypothetical protein
MLYLFFSRSKITIYYIDSLQKIGFQTLNIFYILYRQLVEDWVSNSEHILQMPFVERSYATALEEAEQFLWGDHAMYSVCFFDEACCDLFTCLQVLYDLY